MYDWLHTTHHKSIAYINIVINGSIIISTIIYTTGIAFVTFVLPSFDLYFHTYNKQYFDFHTTFNA